ncbi:MAG: AEC family transporter, partial [Candidatus Omnitrophica bacterium]|nr:AEC family transporter [Candidatus Omnitrophota bacterium]
MVSQSFNVYSTGFGVLQLFIIASLGFFFFKKKIIKKEGCRLLSSLLLWIFFPALIFSRITETFDPTTYPWWWLLPCCAIVMSFCGMFIGLVISTMLPQNNFKREFILSSGFQNCGYLPMALITFIYSGMLCDTILAHIILFVTGFNICIWMFAPAFLSQNDKKSFIISGIFRPPVISVIVSILLVLVFGKGCVSESILFPMRIIGNCSFTLGLLLLGAQLAQYRGYNIHNSIMTTGCL